VSFFIGVFFLSGGVDQWWWAARLLVSKMQDEVKALQLCQSKVRAKKLPMEVIDAEYQWWVRSR